MKLAALFVILCTTPFVPQTPDVDADRAAIRQAVLDYAEGYYDHAPDRMERAISPLLTKRALMVRPGIPPFLTQMNSEMLIEATKGNAPRPAAADRKLVAEVLDVNGDIASARVFSVQFDDYIHLVKRDGRWKLVSVLWHPPLPGPADPAAITPAIESAARDYASGDPQRTVAALSPVAALRTLMSGPSGTRVLGDQN
ncbi:MAG TPA: nuclear transport factor 2 family protein, partial [Vicinamibacterales bacterium]